MIFVDYVFTLCPDGSILLDKELGKDKINVVDGDRFVTKVLHDGQVMFKKLEGIELFFEQAIEDEPNFIKGYN